MMLTPGIASAYCDAIAHIGNIDGIRVTQGEGSGPVPALFETNAAGLSRSLRAAARSIRSLDDTDSLRIANRTRECVEEPRRELDGNDSWHGKGSP